MERAVQVPPSTPFQLPKRPCSAGLQHRQPGLLTELHGASASCYLVACLIGAGTEVMPTPLQADTIDRPLRIALSFPFLSLHKID